MMRLLCLQRATRQTVRGGYCMNNEEFRTLTPIKNLWSNGPGYIGYCPEDGTILLGKSGDSEWVEISKHIADLFCFELVEESD